MSDRMLLVRKLAFGLIGLIVFAGAGIGFYRSRNLKEPVVLGPGVTKVRKLGEYGPSVAGTANDCNVYILEGRQPGGTMMVLGGTHPEEPAGRLAAWLLVENATLEQGRLIVVLSANRSASTTTRPSGAYPADYTIGTPWGGQTFRMGDRWSNPLDQWPDPEVYIHYPSRQSLAYCDSRNLNRAWPGRANGSLTERTCDAFMRLIHAEKVDVFVDLHEAELQYPVISTIVAHDKGQELGMMVSMLLTDTEGFKIGMEFSPKNLRGLSHREVGDHSDAISLLFEAPEPFLDATRGKTDSALLLTGKDEFVMKAGRHGLLFEKIDANGWPIDLRVGRHTSSLVQTMASWTEAHPERGIVGSGVPKYADVKEKGTGAYLQNPAAADPRRVVFE
jgi:predicted deacylase